MVAIKRPELAMAAFAKLVALRVAEPLKPLQFVMIGSGPMHNRLVTMAAAYGLGDRVTFTGSLSHADVAAWMRKADLLLLTSGSEGMPNVVLEALSCGTPVVTTAVGDVKDFVKNGINGFVVHDDDGHALARAAYRVLDGDWKRSEIAASLSVEGWQSSASQALAVMQDSLDDTEEQGARI
jgi:glycosyltransferase involved in cell wall biosynthesis